MTVQLLDTCGVRAGARGRGIVDLDALVDVLQSHSVQPCLLAIYEVGLIYDEGTTPPCQPDLARDGPRGIS